MQKWPLRWTRTTASKSSSRHVEDHAVAEEAGVVDDDVEPAEAFDRAAHEIEGVVPVGDVGMVGERLATERLDLGHDRLGRIVLGFARQRPAVVVHDDAHALAPELESLHPTDPTTGAGDDRDLPLQPCEHLHSHRRSKSELGSSRVADARVAFVSGASRGIGKQSAIALAAAGLDVVITARTLQEGQGVDDSDGDGRSLPGSLESTAQEIEARGQRALSLPMDLHDRSTLGTAVERALGEWGRIDVLVNNAVDTGPGSMSRFEDTTIEQLQAKLDANVVAQVVLIKAVLPAMVERGDGIIVNITSAVATTDPPAPAGEGGWGSAYAMSKGAFHRLAGVLAVEYRDRGVCCFNVEPGFVVTERMSVNARALGLEGKYPGAPPTVPAAVVAWLATSPDAGEHNGTTISAQKFAASRGLAPRLALTPHEERSPWSSRT